MKVEHYNVAYPVILKDGAINYSSPCFHQFDLLILILKCVIIYVNAFNKYYESVYSIEEQKEFKMTIYKFILLQISIKKIGFNFRYGTRVDASYLCQRTSFWSFLLFYPKYHMVRLAKFYKIS